MNIVYRLDDVRNYFLVKSFDPFRGYFFGLGLEKCASTWQEEKSYERRDGLQG